MMGGSAEAALFTVALIALAIKIYAETEANDLTCKLHPLCIHTVDFVHCKRTNTHIHKEEKNR